VAVSPTAAVVVVSDNMRRAITTRGFFCKDIGSSP
jgi:hypothetical protein